MSAILLKIFTLLFPFIKELFLGKEIVSTDPNAPPTLDTNLSKYRILKKILIAIGCLSVVLNVFLIKQSYIISMENVNLQKTIQTLTEVKNNSKPADIVNTPTAVVTPTPSVALSNTVTTIKSSTAKYKTNNNNSKAQKEHQRLIDDFNKLEK